MDDYNNSNIDDDSNSEITPEVDGQDIEDSEQPTDSPLSNGYNRMASSSREAFTNGLNNNYQERIARNKASLQQSINRSNEAKKTNEDGEEREKNILDKAGDKANVLKNKASLLTSQIDSARSKAFQTLHPVEAAKIVAKKKIQAWLIGILVSALPYLLGIFVVFIACFAILGLFDESDNSDGGIVGGTTECGFIISATSLTKREYKNKISDYANNKNSRFQIFADNADEIYEYAKSKHVNPELVVIRAQAEGQGSTTGTYNYWGMGCTNTGGLKACFNYNSFEEAYSDFINLIATYDSLADMMSSYSYIGDYWYTMDTNNPSGDGGCYYSNYIYPNNMPLRVQNACAPSAPSCTINGDKQNCTATTDEDQQAYMNWQVKQNMADIRYKIFGLKYEDGPCNNINSDNDIIINSSGPNWNSDAWTVQVNPYSAGGWYGQCTWFAWGRFYEIYGYSPGFLGNGVTCAPDLVKNHPDKFESSTTPKAGAVFSCSNTYPWGHTGIVMEFDGTNITIQEANLDGVTNTFEDAKKDWREVKLTLSQWNGRCENAVYANPK